MVKTKVKNPNLNKPIPLRPFKNEIDFIREDSAQKGDHSTGKKSALITLEFHVKESQLLSDEEKETLLTKQKRRINDEGILFVSAGEYNSVSQNKQLALKRFYNYLNETLKERKNIFLQYKLRRKLKKENRPKRNPPAARAGKRRKRLSKQKRLKTYQ